MAHSTRRIDYRSEDVWGRHRVRLLEVTFETDQVIELTSAETALPGIVGVIQVGGLVPVAFDPETNSLVAAEPVDGDVVRILVIG